MDGVSTLMSVAGSPAYEAHAFNLGKILFTHKFVNKIKWEHLFEKTKLIRVMMESLSLI